MVQRLRYAGETLTAEQADLEYVLVRPNTWLVLIEYFKDPALMEEFMASNCETTEVTNGLIRASATPYLSQEGQETFDLESDGMEMCLDVSGSATAYTSCALSIFGIEFTTSSVCCAS